MNKSILLLTAALLPVAARADIQQEIDDNLVAEYTFGVSNTNAVAGHGALTAGVTADGDLSVLSWPGPGFADQIAYFAGNAKDSRAQPHFGALDGMGSSIALRVTTAAGTQLSWLRDAAWTHQQSYSQPDAPVPVTIFANAALGLTVTLTDVVSPAQDVLTRHVRIERGAGSPVTAVELDVYENLSPTLSRIEQVPVADWAFPVRNDFLAAWDQDSGAILHFHPGDRAVLVNLVDALSPPADVDYGPVETLMKSSAPQPADVRAFVAGLDQTYAPGVAALVTTEPAPAAFQVGSDATPFCDQVGVMVDNIVALAKTTTLELPIDPNAAAAFRCQDPMPGLRSGHGWAWTPQDARAALAQGALPGSPVAAGQTNGALSVPLAFEGNAAEGSALFAFGPTRAAARAALAAEQSLSFAARQSAAEQAAHAALGSLALPDAALGDRVRAVALRALVNVYVARDRKTGAILASISRQPAYDLDWARDGAFITAGLDLAGRADWATQRFLWYAGLIRTSATIGNPFLTPQIPFDPDSGRQEFPAGAWEMNYYADGTIGGPIRFEIDDTALHLWAIAAHASVLQPSERKTFLQAIWPSSKTALDLLARWTQKSTLLQAPANEDDHSALTSTLHGATAVYAALVAGERMARQLGDRDAETRYGARAAELRTALLANYQDPHSGLFSSVRGGPAGPQGGPTGWLAWPARVLGRGDAHLEAQLSADMDEVLKSLRGETFGGAYLGKNVVAAALYGSESGSRAKAREAVQRLSQLATKDTLHFGEVFITQPDGSFDNRVATPHVWEGMLFYLSAMALSQPSRFNPEESAMPLPSGCSTATAGLGALASLFFLWRHGRRRTSQRRRRAAAP